ncbi:MAG: pilus assembly protein [Steroidobacteraceae bacterium]
MKQTASRLFHFAAGAVLAALGAAAGADETEIFVGTGNTDSQQRPNILFIMDTSGSMSSDVETQVPYDPDTDFSGSCADNVIYYEVGSNTSDPPSCTDATSFPIARFMCNAAAATMADAGYYVADRAAQWRGSPKRWRNINGSNASDAWVECRADAGIHGNGVNTSRLWASDSSGPWSSVSSQQIGWNQNGAGSGYVFYTGNYINWLNNGGTIIQSRLEIMKIVASQTIAQLAASDQVNVGLMQFSNNTNDGCSNTATSEGGMVLEPIGPVGTNSAAMLDAIDDLNADGCTPLSETMYEAYLYLSGGNVDYGLNSRKFPGSGGSQPSVLTSREAAPNTGDYKSPLTESCEKNFIVLLTDGLPTADNSANTEVEALIGGSCTGTGNGRCLDDMSKYMYENDIRPSLAGLQNVTTYTIGFGPEVNSSQLLQNTASLAGGVFYEASDTASLSTVFTNIVRTILDFNTSFTAPAVSVNAFNRTQNLNDLFITVFRPSETYAWDGNIKKYRLTADGTIVDANNQPAVEVTTGFFRTTAQSFWTTGIDGDSVSLGGAANELPTPASRNVFTDINTGVALSANANSLATGNASITTAMLGLGATESPGRDALINWVRGTDIDDADGDGTTTDARLQMGDPMHGRPATVIYGGTVADPDPNDGVIYAVSNEGFLHAINAVDGSELWAFMPQQMLSRARNLYVNDAVTERVYGLDGNIRVIRNEVNTNGVLESGLGERVMIYFGMRRGGSEYYGLDVTDRNNPSVLFKLGPNEAGTKRLTGAGQSWSTPSVARVNISGATQNTLQQMLVFGGGYDTVQDNGPYTVDAAGNQIFMVDAVSGDVLWYAGPSSDTGADLRHASLTHGIPGDVRIFDMTGDGFADRMYAADMGGRVWRFDVHSGQNRANLVTGGVFASLGNSHLATHPIESTRRFYSAPDVAFLTDGGRTWLNVALGSGYRAHPLNLQTEDRFYSLRDHQPFARLTQAQYDAATAITEADVNLIDITDDITPTVPAGASGWRLDLRRPLAGFTGEKNLAEARTVMNMIQFTTYEPNDDSTEQSTACSPGLGTNRLYTISAFTGAPVYDRESPEDPPDSAEDRDQDLAQGGLAPEIVYVFPPPDNPADCEGAECRPDAVGLVGVENVGSLPLGAPVRTFGRQTGVN